MFIYIARRINNTHDAEDLTADVFMKAFVNPYDSKIAKFSTYIYTIAANALKNYYRAAVKNNLSVELDEDIAAQSDILIDLVNREEYDTLHNALTHLTERQYELIYRRYYLEQGFAEIGAGLGISEVYARKIHGRALETLKKLLKECHVSGSSVYNQSKGGGKQDE